MPTGNLPKEGADLHKKVYDAELKGSCNGDKECAARKAWAAVEAAGWSKVGEKWVKKSDIVPEFSMYFSKVGTNTKKWSMTASDTLLDLRDEAMSLDLYKSFTENIEQDKPVPEPFAPLVTDSFWSGGMPYQSIAHYPALDGQAVPGDVHAVYIDGNQLKAKGVFNDTPLGIATWKAVLADKQGTSPFEDKTRVSIGFLDLAHKHGDFIFQRESLDDVCPMCAQGAGNKVYLKGYLVHLAMTRKPVNPRSAVEVDLSMTTRKEDAASIVGEELAEDLAEKQKAIIDKSDVLVERAAAPAEDNDADEMMASGTSSDMPMETDSDTVSVLLAVTKTEGGCSHPSSHFLVVGDPEKVTTWHLRFKDCQGNIDTRLLGAAKAALTSPGGHRGNKYAGPDKEAAIAKLKRLYSAQNLKWTSDVDEELSLSVTLEELSMAADVSETANLETPKVEEKAELSLTDIMNAINEMRSKPVETEKSLIEKSFDGLMEVVRSAMAEQITPDEKLQKIQPALNELATSIQAEVTKPVATESTSATPQVNESDVAVAISTAIQPLVEQMSMLATKVNQMSAAPAERRVPQPRSISPIAVKSLTQTKQRELTPMEKIAAQSVGLNVSE